MKIFVLLFLLLSSLCSSTIKILDIYEYKNKVLRELSALAYDGDILYALSDYGELHHFKLEIKNKKITALNHLRTFKLRDKKNRVLKKKKRDSEGLVYKDKKLYISFERKHRACVFSLDGKKIKKLKLHKELQNTDSFSSKNKGLEALGYSEKYGFITAPEKPAKDQSTHNLYTKKNIYKIKRNGCITALEFLDNNRLLILQRDFNELSKRQLITLSLVDLDKCDAGICRLEVLKILDSYKDKGVDNFEGLTKIDKNLFLMVSDDNASIFQKTLFVLFEIN